MRACGANGANANFDLASWIRDQQQKGYIHIETPMKKNWNSLLILMVSIGPLTNPESRGVWVTRTRLLLWQLLTIETFQSLIFARLDEIVSQISSILYLLPFCILGIKVKSYFQNIKLTSYTTNWTVFEIQNSHHTKWLWVDRAL